MALKVRSTSSQASSRTVRNSAPSSLAVLNEIGSNEAMAAIRLVADQGCDVFFPGEPHFLSVAKSSGVFVRVALDDDRLGSADHDDELDDMSNLLDRFDRSLDGIDAVGL